MNIQLDLFERSLLEDFEAWLSTDEGQEIADQFDAIAIRLHEIGEKEGARAIWEHMRWSNRRRFAGSDGPYRFNNNHVPFLARRFMQRHPDLAGFFDLRKPTPKARPVSAVVIPIQSKRTA